MTLILTCDESLHQTRGETVLGVQGKAAGFRALRRLAADDPRLHVTDLNQLIDRAERQTETLERLRLQAAAQTLAAPNSSATVDGV